MPCCVVPPGVRFNDCLFSEPAPISMWQPSPCAGLVAILVQNPQWRPKPLQPLYFGEFGNDTQGVACLPGDMRREDLLIATLPLPYSTASQRKALCGELIAAHNPAWQTGRTMLPPAEMSRKVEQLEARQQEQNQQILSLLNYLGRIFEPQPVAASKPFGFVPQLPRTASPATETGN